MSEPTLEVKQVIEGIATEIGAGRCLPPIDTPEKQAWNEAHNRCLSIISNYREGCGLFQLTANVKKSADPDTQKEGERGT